MPKILMIDSDEEFCVRLCDFLIWENFQAIHASDGWVGLQWAKRESPDLILCDIDLPELTGYRVLEHLRTDSTTAQIPFIMLTARTDLDSRCIAFALGASDYLTLPVVLEQLRLAITTQLQVAARRSALSAS